MENRAWVLIIRSELNHKMPYRMNTSHSHQVFGFMLSIEICNDSHRHIYDMIFFSGLERVQYWIGASQTAIGTYFFQWTDGSTYIPAELWAAGQPSGVSLYPTWELCIKIRVVDGSLFLYDDYCAKTLSSICQIPSA